MGVVSSIRAGVIAFWSGIRHLFKPRMTLKYPEQKLDLEGSAYPIQPRMEAGLPAGYKFDPRQGVGIAGFKGRHLLREEKCTGCQLCAIACDGVAVAIDMQVLSRKKPQNKKDLWPAVDYGRCVFCGLCVDACPFDALYMTNDYELSAYDRAALKFTPEMLMVPPKIVDQRYKVKVDPERGEITHG
jgi:NADH-quinone oxidoreductase subunit I